MKMEERKKFSVHLDISQIKSSFLNYPLSTKRKIDTSPLSLSPNNSFLSDHRFRPVKPLKSNNSSLKKILAEFKSGKENSFKSNKCSMSRFPLLIDQFVRLYNLTKQEINELGELKQVPSPLNRSTTTSNLRFRARPTTGSSSVSSRTI